MKSDFSCDLVIVGAGIAGQAVAAHLTEFEGIALVVDSGPKVSRTQKVSVSRKSSRLAPVDKYRSFGVGGTSAIWGGNLVPFTNLELENGRWPIDSVRTQNRITSSLEFLGFGDSSSYVAERWEEAFLNVGVGDVTVQEFFRLYQADKKILPTSSTPSPNLKFIEGLRCRSVRRVDDGGGFLLQFVSEENEEVTLEAKTVVLASGTFESARIMNNSKNLNFNRKILGRYFSTHVSGIVGVVSSGPKLELKNDQDRHLIRQEYLHFAAEGEPGLSAWKVTFLNVRTSLFELPSLGLDLPRVLGTLFLNFLRRKNTYMVNVDGDQIPAEQSRLQFLENGKCRVEHYVGESEIHALESVFQKLPDFLPHGSKLHKFINPQKRFIGKSHHLGGLRMANEAEDGIVDGNLEVMGEPGLFICSTAVFPTYSSANPTLMLVQLAIGLADFMSTRWNLEKSK
jgi:choline dehydrogenase-like flavoprotein